MILKLEIFVYNIFILSKLYIYAFTQIGYIPFLLP